MTHARITACISGLLLASFHSSACIAAAAAEQPSNIRDQIPIAWRSCTAAKDCTVIAFSCSGRMAVNRNYKSQAERIIFRSESAAWAACNVPVSSQMRAICPTKICEVDRE